MNIQTFRMGNGPVLLGAYDDFKDYAFFVQKRPEFYTRFEVAQVIEPYQMRSSMTAAEIGVVVDKVRQIQVVNRRAIDLARTFYTDLIMQNPSIQKIAKYKRESDDIGAEAEAAIKMAVAIAQDMQQMKVEEVKQNMPTQPDLISSVVNPSGRVSYKLPEVVRLPEVYGPGVKSGFDMKSLAIPAAALVGAYLIFKG